MIGEKQWQALHAKNAALVKELEAVKAENEELKEKHEDLWCEKCEAERYSEFLEEASNDINKIKADAVIAAKQCAVLGHKELIGAFGEGFDAAVMQYDEHLDKYANSLINKEG